MQLGVATNNPFCVLAPRVRRGFCLSEYPVVSPKKHDTSLVSYGIMSGDGWRRERKAGGVGRDVST